MKFLPKLLLQRKRVFHFGIAYSGIEQHDDKAKVFSECQENLCLSSHLKVLSQNGKLSFLVNLLK